MILSSFLGIFFINNIIATELQKIIRNFAVEKIKKDKESHDCHVFRRR